MIRDFQKFAQDRKGISSLALDGYAGLSAAYINPTIIEERHLNVATMDVFSRLLGVPINDDVANIIQAQLLYLESADPESDIQLYINSPGGQVYAGWGIYDTMNLVNPKVCTICTGMAASMAAILLAAGVKGRRSALPHSRIMIHQPMGGTSGQASDIEIEAREIIKTKQELYESLAENTGKTLEAKEYGMIDEILTKAKK